MVTSAVLYLLAMTLHAAEWASARTVKVAEPELATVGAGGAASAGPTEAVPPVERPVPSRRTDALGRAGLAITVVAVLTHVTGVVLRGIAAGRAPWGNMYEFITTSLAIAAIAYLVLALRYGMRWLGLPVTLLLTIGQGLAVTVFYVAVSDLMPALHSVWFVIHIIAAATAGAALNIGGIAAILYLIRSRAEERGRVRGYLARIPASETLDRVSYRFHAFAFPLWTFTIAAGAIWAQYAWGRFWGWDPKETWSLVTWIIYAGYLHARATAGWKGRRAAVVAVIGLASFWFNFVGINLLVSGLHSYAGI
ncbi:c-type cytochrome biogenesis protein CcsB [Propionicimonas sp.]|uniref:c-type cytochrome biogenesis protein CcsB n=1 Tax=Propionicimonas sp. TaxID=1955623 RepID=UPI003D0E5AF0